ncbi:MAG: site-specific DNA-methyltransferase [Acetobacter sp.]|nr:site-specific DNA-methyltransferase [Acetobacter sp.]
MKEEEKSGAPALSNKDKLDRKFGQSLDLIAQNIEVLKRLFPDIVTEGKIDFDCLREILGEEIETKEEHYSFTWHGKKKARRFTLTPIMGTLRPCQEESVDWDNTQNLMIEGDNAEVLKLLQKSYYGKIKMIYIDPPYNTGNDFVYSDDYQAPLDSYLRETGQVDEAGHKTSTNPQTSGRFHTKWLNMIYPRLILAKSLLRDDGVIFISIDDNEQANLKKICDEVFGEENFVADFIRKTKSTTNDAKTGVNYQHEFLLCFARNKGQVSLLGGEKDLSNYKNPDNDPNGAWVSDNPSAKSGNTATGWFPVKNPYTGKEDYPPEGMFWRFSKNTIQKHIEEGRICFKKDHKPNERGFIFKRYLKDLQTTQSMFDSLAFVDNAFMNQAATKELKELGLVENFSYPKGVEFIKKILLHSTNEDSIILDFFAGSGTTGEAVMRFNAEHTAKSEESLGGGGRMGHVLFWCSCLKLVLKKVRRFMPAIRQLPTYVKNVYGGQAKKFKPNTPTKSLMWAFAFSNSIALISKHGIQRLKPLRTI